MVEVGWMVVVMGPVPKVGVNLFWYCRVFLLGHVTRKFSPIEYSDPVGLWRENTRPWLLTSL